MEERKNINIKLLSARTRSETIKLKREYNEKHREVQKKVRADRKQFIEDLATQAETATENRNMREHHQTTFSKKIFSWKANKRV